jgi:hypothetical protein
VVYAIILACVRLRQEDHKFEASLGYIASPYLKNKNKKNNFHPKVSIS